MKQLLELGVARKESLTPCHLSKDATDGPDINGGGVMSGSKKNLRSPVPESNDLVRVALERNGEGASESKICDLQNPPVLVDQQILGLEIAVENAVGVAVSDALAELVEETLNQGRREGPRVGALAMRIDELFEIGFEVLEDEVEERLAVFVEGGFDAEEADDVERLGEHLEQGDFAERGRGNTFFVHFETGFLQGDDFAALLVFSFVHLPVRSFSHLLQFLVLFHFFSDFDLLLLLLFLSVCFVNSNL